MNKIEELIFNYLEAKANYSGVEDEYEIVTAANFIEPEEGDYEDFGENVEDVTITIGAKDEPKKKKVKLNKPFRTPGGPKKFSVYVKNDKGNVVKVNFGDPNMKIKKNIPERRKSFRARHKCDTPGPKWKARYWACKSW